jgi:hypothetical protein
VIVGSSIGQHGRGSGSADRPPLADGCAKAIALAAVRVAAAALVVVVAARRWTA